MGVSRSGYYKWLIRPKVTYSDILEVIIEEIFNKSKRIYGYRRIKEALLKRGVSLGRERIRSLMKKRGLLAKAARKYKATTNSNHNLPVAENLLLQEFDVSGPNKVWVSDFTYILTNEGWLYLAVVMDLYSRKIVGFNIHHRMTKDLVIGALNMAIRNRVINPGLIVHSDRGSQYCSNDYQKILREYSLRCSMSKKGDPYDNACAESFFHSLKVEWIFGEIFASRTACRESLVEYIEIFYNRQRLHSYLNYQTPCEYEAC